MWLYIQSAFLVDSMLLGLDIGCVNISLPRRVGPIGATSLPVQYDLFILVTRDLRLWEKKWIGQKNIPTTFEYELRFRYLILSYFFVTGILSHHLHWNWGALRISFFRFDFQKKKMFQLKGGRMRAIVLFWISLKHLTLPASVTWTCSK